MTRAEIQQMILDQTGLKTTVKKLSGSMKHHTCFSVMFQGGEYPKYPFQWRQEFTKQFKCYGDHGNYSSDYSIEILTQNIEEGEPLIYKKERKPKPIDPNKPQKGWGSKNSQMRLDKATARNAVKLRAGTTARYY